MGLLYIYIYIYYIVLYTPSQNQPEDSFKKPKHVAENWKFMKYLIKSCVRLYFNTLIKRNTMGMPCLKIIS